MVMEAGFDSRDRVMLDIVHTATAQVIREDDSLP